MAYPSLVRFVVVAGEVEPVVGLDVVVQISCFLEKHPIPHRYFAGGRMNHHYLPILKEVEPLFELVLLIDDWLVVIITVEFHYVYHCLLNH